MVRGGQVLSPVVRNYKDTMFRMIFRDKIDLLSLYNAVNETAYDNPEELEIVTLENAVYMNMKNDLAFILDYELHLYEHQSTWNPNMPLRDLIYVSSELQKIVGDKALYSKVLKKIPTPRFFLFYNGTAEQPEQMTLRLSDAFKKPLENPDLELMVHVFNINYGKNKRLMENCKKLQEYSLYVKKVREYVQDMPLAEAVERTVEECICEGILEEFLRKNRAEAIAMSIFEYDEEEVLKMIRQEEREEGWQAGKQAGMEELLFSLVRDGEILVQNAASKLGITVEETITKMRELGYQIPKQ